MFRLFECCALSFFERFVLSFSLKIERFVSDSAEIWICGLYKCDSGELTEEGVNDILAEITISEWKSDPREPHDVPDDYIPPSSNC